jgi:hypothetical protein
VSIEVLAVRIGRVIDEDSKPTLVPKQDFEAVRARIDRAGMIDAHAA